ncbi:MAG: transcription termination/antitermination protein NusA [Candidatus Moranbacteria bacterium]|nr:transcription termination/antitermination protein NusA [Candidatus Moranbacteria bacterium]
MAKKTEKNPFGDFAGAMTAIAEEKGIDKDTILKTVEAAIAAAYKKEYGKRGQNIRAELNTVSGDMKFFLVKEVIDESIREFVEFDEETGEVKIDEDKSKKQEKKVEEKTDGEVKTEDEVAEEDKKTRFNQERDIILEDALKRDADVKIGDFLEEELPTYSEFGRVAAQTAKQVIIQRIREAEREAMFDEYKEKEGEIIAGTVQRVEGRVVFVDLGKSVGVLFPREQVRGEFYNVGQRIKVYLESVESDPKGPGIKLSRVHPELVRRLFENEVPEIFSGTVEIKAIAREAGSRTKIAVYTEDESIDPIGSCVGQRGSRVNTIIDELGGEKIDIIEWNEDVEDFIAAALSPAQVLRVNLNEEEKKASVLVPEDQLSLAIGKQGQNVRLAVKLTGWDLDVVNSEGDKKDGEKSDNKVEKDSDSKEKKVEGSEEIKEEKVEKVALEEKKIEDGKADSEVVEETEKEEIKEEFIKVEEEKKEEK